MEFSDIELVEMFLRVSRMMRRGTHRPPPPLPPDGGCLPPSPPPFGMGRVLDRLLTAEADSLTQTGLAEALEMRPQSLSEALARLESDGMIARRGDDADRRVQRVCLTEKGRDIAAGRRAERESFAATLLAPLDAHERETLRALMKKMLDGGDAL